MNDFLKKISLPFIFLLTLSLFLVASPNNKTVLAVSVGEKEAVQKFIKENSKDLFNLPSDKVKIKDIRDDNGLLKVTLDLNGEEQTFYLTKFLKIVSQFIDLAKISKGEVKQIGQGNGQKQITINEETKKQIKNFIEKYLLSQKVPVEIKSVTVKDGLYYLDISLAGQSQPLYLSLNGRKLAFGVITLDEYKKIVAANKKQTAVSPEKRTDRPKVELFVMSYCPYGTQIEKGILPVLDLLKGKIDAQIKFVDYAMHGKKELDENLRQHCLQKQSPEKFTDYLKCFLEEGNAKKCLAEIKLNEKDKTPTSWFQKVINWFKSLFHLGKSENGQAELEQCVRETDKQFNVTQDYNDKSTWKGRFPGFKINQEDNKKYNVQGSPTLIINGERITTGRDPQSLLKAICSGFKNPPQECQTKLSNQTPGPGFGNQTSASGSGGGCGQ